MKCPYCAFVDSRVLESRPTAEHTAIRRRRQCLQCERRFTTYERIETIPLMVIKKDGTREEFDRNKILQGLMTAAEKRTIPMATLERIVDRIEQQLHNTLEREIASQKIGELVMNALRDIDHVAYVRFASVYRDFRDVKQFSQELEALLREKEP